MFTLNHSRNMPYGAFELKAHYQRNMMIGHLGLLMIVTLALTLPLALDALFGQTMVVLPVGPEEEKVVTIIRLPNPPPLEQPRAPQQPVAPPPQQTITNQIVAVVDSSWNDDQPEEVLPSRNDLSDYNIAGDTGFDGSGIDTTALFGDDYLPDIDSFVVLEVYPQMIHMETPVYPSIARATGTTGRVVIKALLDQEGKVIDARVLVSSGSSILDEAAVRAAYKNVFSPGVQNGIPVKCWVTYKVDFKVDR
ncbi:MAG: energy transducer TonB [bacterium]|nr:energy transducer TonB [bacterium]